MRLKWRVDGAEGDRLCEERFGESGGRMRAGDE